MPKAFRIEIKGLDRLQNTVANLKNAALIDVDLEMLLAAVEIQEQAIRNIRANGANDQGLLMASMVLVQDREHRRYQTGNTAYYSPYIEFGTGAKVNVPAEWKDYASQFMGPAGHGTFDDFVNNLIDWMKRKGIVPDTGTNWDDYDHFAFMVALKILHNGLAPHPFLYPAYQQVTKNLKQRIITILNDAAKK